MIDRVSKAVIPAAGHGTRFLPVTKSIPKEMLPILGRPVIDYVVEEAVDAGCVDILIVLSRGKEAIRRYFDRSPELESQLELNRNFEALEKIRGIGAGAVISYVYQNKIVGLGDAVMTAREFCGDDPFLVLLGDTIISPHVASLMTKCFALRKTSLVGVEKIEMEYTTRYGMVDPCPDSDIDDTTDRVGSFPLKGLVEKPARDEAPSPWAIAARYLFTPELWPGLEESSANGGGEIQLTEAIDKLARRYTPDAGGVRAVPIPGVRYDLGNPRDFLRAEIEIAKYIL